MRSLLIFSRRVIRSKTWTSWCIIDYCKLFVFYFFYISSYFAEFMVQDFHLLKFMFYLSSLTFFMLILAIANNFIRMFVGWGGVGLCSYLLINSWSTQIQVNKAVIRAIILNRIGFFGLVIGILIVFIEYKVIDHATVFVLTLVFMHKLFNFWF